MRTMLAVLALASVAGCALPDPHAPTAQIEWIGARSPDLRKVTAVVRVTPPARLKATFEAAAARTDDADFGNFLHAQASGGFGSGFLMVHRDDSGIAAFVVTNRHVVAEAEQAEIGFGDGTTYKDCDVVYASAKYDLAVLALPDAAVRALGFGLVPAGDDAQDRLGVVAAGYPGVGGHPSYQVTDGKVSNAKFSLPDVGFEGTFVQHTAPIDPGSSGGPLTDETGRLVGVNVMLMRKRASMFFAVPTSAVVETVRHAHSLLTRRRSTTWMSTELESACSAVAGELGSNTRSMPRLASFVGNAFVADRGLESYSLVSAIDGVGPVLRRTFFEDPFTALRASLLVRLTVRTNLAGGATGLCGRVNPGDAAAIADGRPVRLGLPTKDGSTIELRWRFEHGNWRIVDGDLALPRIASAPASEPAKPAVATKAKASK